MEALFDRPHYLAKQRQHLQTGNDLSQRMSLELVERLQLIKRSFSRALIIGYDAPYLAAALQLTGQIENLDVKPLAATPDLHLPEQHYDAIFHVLDLHAENDVPGLLAQINRSLKPDGLFLGCLFASHNLDELRQTWLMAETRILAGVSPRLPPSIDVRTLGSLLQRAKFALPVVDLDRVVLRYSHVLNLLQEIKSFGLSLRLQSTQPKPTSRRLLQALSDAYMENFSDADGRIRVTLEIAWLTAWRCHDSQPKPLKPGSAQMRLEDALTMIRASGDQVDTTDKRKDAENTELERRDESN